ncbi:MULTISPECIES: hypothetical protein [unclassified Streptomyces]|uniref:hypothetical protein n=1 Tax=unclassified Streptomyces TaxID=2593676 RepID=UPI00339E6778
MATGDFDIFVGIRPGCASSLPLDGEVACDIADILLGACTESLGKFGRVFRIQSDAASAVVANVEGSGEFIASIFIDHPCDVQLNYVDDCDNWADSQELARFVFQALDALGKYEMFMTHDEEQLVEANFSHPDLEALEIFTYW